MLLTGFCKLLHQTHKSLFSLLISLCTTQEQGLFDHPILFRVIKRSFDVISVAVQQGFFSLSARDSCR